MSAKELAECIEMQLMELEILQSIYPNQNEFVIEDDEAYLEAKNFLLNTDMLLKRKLSFVIKFNANIKKSTKSNKSEDDESNYDQLQLEIICRLPHTYPLQSPPDVFVRCLNHNLNRKFSESLSSYAKESHTMECSILNIIEWVKDNIEDFLNQENSPSTHPSNSSANSPQINNRVTFCRMFIYSHHIYSINKRRDIVQWSKDLHLNGFSMPGKPGFICVEGLKSNVQEYWSRLRALAWHKLQIKDTQSFEVAEDKLNELRKFDNFEEKNFCVNNSNNNVDLGKLLEFLKEKDLNYVFSLCFGVEGK